jgi:hypothetical protein
VVYDNLAPGLSDGGTVNVTFGGYYSRNTFGVNNVYYYTNSLENKKLEFTGDFSRIYDNYGKGIRRRNSSANKPWTMDDEDAVEWQYRVSDPVSAVKDYYSEWLPLAQNYQELNLQEEIDDNLNADRNVSVQFRDGLGIESGWSRIGIIRYFTPAEYRKVENWNALYDENTGTITVSAKNPQDMDGVEFSANGITWERRHSTDSEGNQIYTISNVPAIYSFPVLSGQPVGNICGYNVRIRAVNAFGVSEPVEFKIWNIQGMKVDNGSQVIEITSAAGSYNSTDRTIGLSNITLNDTSAQYVLSGPVTLSSWTPRGTEAQPFTGKFYGNGQKITVSANYSGVTCGIFAFVKDALIRDLFVEYTGSRTANNSLYTGGIAGRASGETEIINCIVSGAAGSGLSAESTVDDVYLGGILGKMEGSVTLINCYSGIDLKLVNKKAGGKAAVGGAAGIIEGGAAGDEALLSDLRVTGNISCMADNAEAGGAAGFCAAEKIITVRRASFAGTLGTE